MTTFDTSRSINSSPDQSLCQLKYIIEDQDIGQRLDKILSQQWPEISRTFLARLIEQGHLKKNETPITKATKKVKKGEIYELNIPSPEPAKPKPENIPLNIYYEDSHLLVLSKPSGLVVHPAPGHSQHTLVHALLHHCKGQLSGIGGVERPGIVHRLDKDTSGLMVVAKTDQAHRHLSEQFQYHKKNLNRTYLALTYGCPKNIKGTINENIARHPQHRQKMACISQGKEAITHYKVLWKRDDQTTSLIQCQLETGRTHQIRVHLQTLGVSIIGDPVYKQYQQQNQQKMPLLLREYLNKISGQSLHAHTLSFQHPTSKEQMSFQAPLPETFNVILYKIKNIL